MKKFTSKLLDYLKEKVPNFQQKHMLFTCPVCGELRCNMIPNSDRIHCHKCNKALGNIFDIINILEPNIYVSKDDMIKYLKQKYHIDHTTNDDIQKVFDSYQLLGFDLVPIAVNSKIPMEKDWLNKEHKSKEEWNKWLDNGLNFGIKAGKKSGITTLDFDTKEIPEPILSLLNDTLKTVTERGMHYVYLYEESLPTTRVNEFQLDIINDGKQFVVFPSKINLKYRKELEGVLTKMSPQLLEYLQKKVKNAPVQLSQDKIINNIQENSLEDVNFELVKEGSRNSFLLHLGGILRKEMNLTNVGTALSIINRLCCKPPYPRRELETLVKGLDKYCVHDERELAGKIMNYLRIVGEASAKDVQEVVGESKEKTDKALAYLVKEGLAIKIRRTFKVLETIDWKDTFFEKDKSIEWKVPYFHDTATFRPGDMILIGGQQKVGKSHIAMNFVKRLVLQNIKPYYLNLEAGNRFAKIATTLSLKDGDFYNATHFSPESIDLKDNAVTIIDWLLPKDYANTDKLFQHFSEQLVKHGGLLIIFVQLRTNADFFAKDLIAMFPAFVCRYLYEKDDKGVENPTLGSFHVDYIREPKGRIKSHKIPCRYNFETKQLQLVSELDMSTDRGNTPVVDTGDFTVANEETLEKIDPLLKEEDED